MARSKSFPAPPLSVDESSATIDSAVPMMASTLVPFAMRSARS